MHFSPACALFTNCTACPLREGTSRARPCTRVSPNVLTPDPFSDAVVVQSTCRRRGVYSRHVRQLDDSDHRQGAKRRAPITAQQAVLFCRSLDELGQKGNGNFTAATVRKMLSKGKAELKAAGLQEAADRVEHRRLTEEAAVLAAAERAEARRACEASESDARTARMWAAAPPESEEEQSDEASDGEEGDDGGWGPHDGEDDASDDADDSEPEDDEAAPAAKRPCVVTLPSIADAMSLAARDDVARVQRRAEEKAAREVQALAGRLAERGEVAEERRRLMGRCVQYRSVISNYCQRNKVHQRNRNAAGLSTAPQAVRDACERLQQVEAQLKAGAA